MMLVISIMTLAQSPMTYESKNETHLVGPITVEDLSQDTALEIIALYNGEKTKQGPNGEEKGMGIHRVPTFIFEQGGKEIARIVEDPATDFETDIAQIALGFI